MQLHLALLALLLYVKYFTRYAASVGYLPTQRTRLNFTRISFPSPIIIVRTIMRLYKAFNIKQNYNGIKDYYFLMFPYEILRSIYCYIAMDYEGTGSSSPKILLAAQVLPLISNTFPVDVAGIQDVLRLKRWSMSGTSLPSVKWLQNINSCQKFERQSPSSPF